MNKTVSAIALSVLLATPAMAADMRAPAYKAPPAAAPVAAYNWSGCYVGAGGGYGMFNEKTQFIENGVGPSGLSNDNAGRGWFGTVQVGCDYQVGSNFVIGAFADYDFGGNIKGDMAVGSFSWIGEEKLKHSWAAGGRIGWLPFQQLLVFVSGGYTQAKFDQVNFTFSGLLVFPTPWAITKHTYSGWFVGAGYEYGLSFLPGLFWKTEYRYAEYGSDLVPITFNGNVSLDSLELNKRIHTVRSELVWRFNFGGPVVARY